MYILGISCFHNDAAAALIKDGTLVAAVEEERFTGKRHDPSFPKQAIQYCLSEEGIASKDLDYIGFYDKPFLRLERILTTYLTTFPKSINSFLKTMPGWLKDKLWTPQIIRQELDYKGPIIYSERHMSHAAGAFFISPFDEAAIITVDGAGEWDTATLAVGKGTEINLLKSLVFPHSLGSLCSSFTYYLGFKVNSEEHKIMELAPYGEPRYYDLIVKELISLKEDGSFRLNMKYFAYDYSLDLINKKFCELFGSPRRDSHSHITKFYIDVAASIQMVINEVVARMAKYLRKETGMKYLCISGGVTLSCVSSNKIFSSSGFDDIFIQPIAGDAGGAVGVAYYINHMALHNYRNFVWSNNLLGQSFTDENIETRLKELDLPYKCYKRQELLSKTAALIADQKIIGWFQGKMEFGPHAFGARSILADPRSTENNFRINFKIKYRNSIGFSAAIILLERLKDYFDIDRPSPYVPFIAKVKGNSKQLPAVAQVDGSISMQSLSRDVNPLFYDLIIEFEKLTRCPVLLNTSFNISGEPIVRTPIDALQCFLRTDMDYLIIGSYIVDKQELVGSNKQIFFDD